jgi:hypothetical protein
MGVTKDRIKFIAPPRKLVEVTDEKGIDEIARWHQRIIADAESILGREPHRQELLQRLTMQLGMLSDGSRKA